MTVCDGGAVSLASLDNPGCSVEHDVIRGLGLIFQTLSDTYAAALAEVGDTPGKAVSTVRAYASLIVNELNDTSQASAEEIELYQVGPQNASLFVVCVSDSIVERWFERHLLTLQDTE